MKKGKFYVIDDGGLPVTEQEFSSRDEASAFAAKHWIEKSSVRHVQAKTFFSGYVGMYWTVGESRFVIEGTL